MPNLIAGSIIQTSTVNNGISQGFSKQILFAVGVRAEEELGAYLLG